MADYRAIATVTAGIRQLLYGPIVAAVGDARITNKRPDAIARSPQAVGVNIFLYQVTPNAALRNQALPTRDAHGRPVSRPTSALDLHYILSFVGSTDHLVPELLLGRTVETLTARPQLTGPMLRALSENGPDAVAGCDLHQQVEAITLTQVALDLEHLSRLWTTFFQTPYVLSLVLRASVVLVEAPVAVSPALPIARSPEPWVAPGGPPRLEHAGGDEALALGHSLRLRVGLAGTGPARLRMVPAGSAGADPDDVSPGLLVPLPDGLRTTLATGPRELELVPPGWREHHRPTPTTRVFLRLSDDQWRLLRAGDVELRLEQELLAPDQVEAVVQAHQEGEPRPKQPAGRPAADRVFLRSDPLRLVVLPSLRLVAEGVAYQSPPSLAGTTHRSGVVDLVVWPEVGPDDAVELLLVPRHGQRGLPTPPPLRAARRNAATTDLSFPYSDLPLGSYLARVRVHGLVSRLESKRGLLDWPIVELR